MHEITKSVFTKSRQRKFSGCVLKVSKEETAYPGRPVLLSHVCGTGGIERRHIAIQESAEGIVGQREMAEGPNGREGK